MIYCYCIPWLSDFKCTTNQLVGYESLFVVTGLWSPPRLWLLAETRGTYGNMFSYKRSWADWNLWTEMGAIDQYLVADDDSMGSDSGKQKLEQKKPMFKIR